MHILTPYRIASMTFGCALKVPQCVAKQGLDTLAIHSMEVTRGAGNTALPSKVDFYISFCRLHHIIADVLETFYNSSDSKSDPDPSRNFTDAKSSPPLSFDKFTSLFRIESELCNWTKDLHSCFQMPSDLEDPTPTKYIIREANVLRARFVSRYAGNVECGMRTNDLLKDIFPSGFSFLGRSFHRCTVERQKMLLASVCTRRSKPLDIWYLNAKFSVSKLPRI